MSTTFNPATAATPFETSTRTLTIAVAAALLGALLILILFVLPAERGIDPTGIGSALGLAQMRGNASESKGVPVPTQASVAAVTEPQTKQTISKDAALRSDDMTVVLKPHTGAEIKALMRTGDHFVFRWEATGPVTMDMHGERPNAGDEFTRYWKEADQTSAQGAFTAPFDGRHGWHWRNRSEKDVTIKVHTVGFYESLIQPH
jgi:hypothetical protein